MIQKAEWRKILIDRRKSISPTRRKEASHLAYEALKLKGRLLSFTPIGSEIDLTSLNKFLASQGKLELVPYETEAPLIHAPLLNIDCILVPALGFDRQNYRIGYGKGWYDRFLSKVKDIPTLGVGFKEQLCEELLPKDSWDVPVKEVLLF